jgi:hypothetical protein
MIVRIASILGLLLALPYWSMAADDSHLVALPDLPVVLPYASEQQRNVITQLYDNSRQGANLTETTLTPRNVIPGKFKLLHTALVQGQVLTQPLFVRDVDLGARGIKNLVIVATAANIVYALDASDLSVVFSKALVHGDPVAVDPAEMNLPSFCAETYPPYVGVTSTPVIDVNDGSVFVESYDSAFPRQIIHKLNLHDQFANDERLMVQPPGLSSEQAKEWPMHERNRAGLLLLNGVVYLAFSSFICDNPRPYSGWVLGYRASDLSQAASWETPDKGDAGSSGIWQSGRGLVGSDDGYIYLMTGNDNNINELTDHTDDSDDFVGPRLANSFVKLSASGPNGLEVAGSFTPKNTSQLSAGDTDLGSSGPILLPGNRLLGGGKQGRTYVLDTSTMKSLQNRTAFPGDGFQGFPAFINNYHNDSHNPFCTKGYDGGHPDQYCRKFIRQDALAKCDYDQGIPPNITAPTATTGSTITSPLQSGCYVEPTCYQYCQSYGPNLHAGFIYWQSSSDGGRVYAMPEKEHLKAFQYDPAEGKIDEVPAAASDLIVPDGMPGAALSLSANRNQDGIVWASLPNQMDATWGIHRGSLAALDALDLHELWRDDCVWYFAKFNPPTVADGHVFLATFANPVIDRLPDDEQNCGLPDPQIDPNPKSPGSAWILEYGLAPQD